MLFRPHPRSAQPSRADFGPPPAGGFVGYFRLPAATSRATGWVCQCRDAGGRGVEVEAPALVIDPARVRFRILKELADEPRPEESLVREQIHPALTRLQERLARSTKIEALVDYGCPPAAPEASIIVPLYRRLDLLEHQLFHFARDPDLRDAELLYVLDSPAQAASLDRQAAGLHELYDMPFRVAVLSHNVGVALARGLGARRARGRLLAFLDSDVLPRRSGWLSALIAFYDSRKAIGALGPKLLYEDDTIQSAGLRFRRTVGLSARWEQASRFHGLHRELHDANRARSVPAVSGACLVVDRERYENAEGFRADYIQGGYEDSDLCFRLEAAGYENWYLPEVELYHLEAMSYPAKIRSKVEPYNAWFHGHLWGERMNASDDAESEETHD